MESSLLDPPRTPVPGPPEGLSPPPRNSMEDADSSVTRKRPRLDSGDRAYRSMSAEPSSMAVTGTASSDCGQTSPTRAEELQGNTHTSQDASDATPLQQLDGTPSKVTINVRDQNPVGSPARSVTLEADNARYEATENSSAQNPVMSSDKYASSPPQLDAPLPSAMGSPEIEVAEPEDIEGHTGPTVWIRPRKSFFDLDDFQESLLSSFPFMQRSLSVQACITRLGDVLSIGSLMDGRHLVELAEWIESFLDRTKAMPEHWYELHHSAQDFWDLLPDVLLRLLRRSTHKYSEDFFRSWEREENDHTENPLLKLFVAFGALVARLLLVDCQTLKDNAEDIAVQPDLLSAKYAECLAQIVAPPNDNSLYRALRTYGWDIDVMVDTAVHSFVTAPTNGLESLSRCVVLEMDRNPLDTEALFRFMACVATITKRGKLHTRRESGGAQSILQRGLIQRESLALFRTSDQKLQTMISKQASSLTFEILKQIISSLSTVLRIILGSDHDLAQEMTPVGYTEYILDDGPNPQEPTFPSRIELVDFAWKIDLWKKCIVHGRMETRIMGVETMQEALVLVWKNHIHQKQEPYDVVVEYLADFILRTKLVDYLVGVESHPQIIQRSKNIVGFLIVTSKYTEKETDVIWNSVEASQDPRTIEAILEMLKGILELSSHEILVYLCQKLMGLPIRLFDSKMTMYCNLLINNLNRQWKTSLLGHVDMIPFDLMIRLLRESVSDLSLATKRKKELWSFAMHQLKSITGWRIEETEKERIYEQCLKDISQGSTFSTGSITTLNIFLDTNPEAEMMRFVSFPDASCVIVKDFTRFTEIGVASNVNFEEYPELVTDRLRVVQKLVMYAPDQLTPELTQDLWASLVGARALHDDARDSAWSLLARVVQQSQHRNSFLDKCLQSLLAGLDPEFLTPAALDFVDQLTEYEFRVTVVDLDQIDENKEALKGSLFWHISLTVPNQEIGAKAINSFVKLNLEDSRGHSTEHASIAERHGRLMERCIHSLIEAANQLKRLREGLSSDEEDSMVIVASERDVSAAKLRFLRSFAMLKELMQGLRSGQLGSPTSTTVSSVSEHNLRGNEVSIQYQPHVGGKSTGIFTLKIGDLADLDDLVERLSKLTGFSEFTMIASGQRINFLANAKTTIRNMRILQNGLLLIQKTPGTKSVKGTGVATRLLPLERELMKHFRDLYDLLTIDSDLGQEVFNFLTTFPPHDDITSLVTEEARPVSELFPIQFPYKAMYSVYALRGVLSQRLQEGAASHNLICHGVRATAKAAMGLGFPTGSKLSLMDSMLARDLIECLLLFLKEPVPQDVSALYFEEPAVLIDSVRGLIDAAQNSDTTDDNTALISASFAVLLEASVHSSSVWQFFRNHPPSSTMLRGIWLECSNLDVRKATIGSVKAIFVASSTFKAFDFRDFTAFFWDAILGMIPDTPHYHQTSEQLFEIAFEVFRRIEEYEQDNLPLVLYLQTWSDILLNFHHEETVGSLSTDWVVQGLTELIRWCIQLMKAKKKPLDISGNLMEKIFTTHLFPKIAPRHSNVGAKAQAPVLDARTRGSLYSVLLGLTTDLPRFQQLLELTSSLLPANYETSYSWSHGYAQISEDHVYDCNFNFDRFRAMRSHTGYPGMKNLSNTCYMNSLLTQLFMNINFREFVLKTKLTDADGSQKLLLESKKLFAYLQETWLRAVDPDNVAGSIVTYEASPIDVSIQMDVDEFYNLLFDRWESQIPSDTEKKKFRQFYGGQIVQQIKSKDCPHISERLEPFSAIQCEIQGKGSLLESLNAYVEGEVMEGDNKYSCGSCGSYVNAVKRACLKDIPDNLIFHLKRFDYDLMTGMRNKINDFFEFPLEVDMGPYNVEYLKDPQSTPLPDKFMLVGVLVHSGNAEAGHYYSYIRERPGRSDSWVEFNDADVTPFDPINLRDQCFGGWCGQLYGGMQYPKTWNAYMLFYQRISSMDADQEKLLSSNMSVPVKVDIPIETSERLCYENETWIRKFCLFDPEHARFVRLMLEQFRDLRKDACSEDHGLEADVINFTLHHIEMIFCRQKDCQGLSSVLDSLGRMVEHCSECCKLYLEWILSRDSAMRSLLFRCPDESMRKRSGAMIINALKYIRNQDPSQYGSDCDTDEDEDGSSVSRRLELGGVFVGAVRSLRDSIKFLPSHPKAWDDYHSLLLGLTSFGRWECSVLHRAGILTHCLQILIIECHKNMVKQWPHLVGFIKGLEKNRYSLRKLTALLAALLRSVTWDEPITHLDHSQDGEYQQRTEATYRLTEEEMTMLIAIEPESTDRNLKQICFLDKVLSLDKLFGSGGVEPSVCQDLVSILVQEQALTGMHRDIYGTILNGTSVDPAVFAKPYLHAGLAFCENCPDAGMVRGLIARFAREISSIGNTGGEEHLEFFKRASRLQNDAFSRQKPKFFQFEVLKQAANFGPLLLMYHDAAVRQETIKFLSSLVFDHDIHEMDDERHADLVESIGQQLTKGCITRIEDIIRHNKAIDIARAEDISRVVKHCLERYFYPDGSPNDATLRALKLVDNLCNLAILSPDDALSDAGVNGSDELPSDTDSGLAYHSDY